MATTKTVKEETTNTSSTTANSPICGHEPNNGGNTVFVHVNPSSFRAVVQKLTGAPIMNSAPADLSILPPAKRPKLQERRWGVAPARLDIPFSTQIISHLRKPVGTDISLSPVSTLDYAFFLASNNYNSPLSSDPIPFGRISGPSVVLTKEEEEIEEKAISEKGFYLHYSPRGGENGAEPKLLPLFPVLSPKSMAFSSFS